MSAMPTNKAPNLQRFIKLWTKVVFWDGLVRKLSLNPATAKNILPHGFEMSNDISWSEKSENKLQMSEAFFSLGSYRGYSLFIAKKRIPSNFYQLWTKVAFKCRLCLQIKPQTCKGLKSFEPKTIFECKLCLQIVPEHGDSRCTLKPALALPFAVADILPHGFFSLVSSNNVFQQRWTWNSCLRPLHWKTNKKL